MKNTNTLKCRPLLVQEIKDMISWIKYLDRSAVLTECSIVAEVFYGILTHQKIQICACYPNNYSDIISNILQTYLFLFRSKELDACIFGFVAIEKHEIWHHEFIFKLMVSNYWGSIYACICSVGVWVQAKNINNIIYYLARKMITNQYFTLVIIQIFVIGSISFLSVC